MSLSDNRGTFLDREPVGMGLAIASAFIPCESCGEQPVDPNYKGPDGQSICDDCRESRCGCGAELDENGEHEGGYGAWCS